jgi:hypothetical protein
MLLYGIVWVSLILSYVTEIRKTHVIGSDSPAAPGGLDTGMRAAMALEQP